MRQLFWGLGVLTFFAAQHAAEPLGTKEAQGRFIAYRPADFLLQMSSHVLNREVFLFVDDPGVHTLPIKVVYEHFGYSDLPDAAMKEGAVLRLRLRRNDKCDESFGSFMRSAQARKVGSSAPEKPAGTEGVVFLGSFDRSTIPEKTVLKCYVLNKGDFQLLFGGGKRKK